MKPIALTAAACVLAILFIAIAFLYSQQQQAPRNTTSTTIAYSTTTVIPIPSNGTNQSVRIRWMIESSSLNALINLNATLAKAAFDNPGTFVLDGNPPLGWTSKRMKTVHSYDQLLLFLNSSGSAEYNGVMLDQENWSFTPSYEQHNSVYYTMLSENLSHSKGMVFAASPAIDLMNSLGYHSNQPVMFEQLGIAGNTSKYADIYELQAQRMGQNSSEFYNFSIFEYNHVKRSNPHALFFIGLSTNIAGGENITANALYNDVNSTRGFAAGYWLNVPNTSAYCPTCGKSRPEVAMELLRMLYGKSLQSGSNAIA